ncbi:MAG TPA: hypothetical protein VNZ86_19360 [Bacteroidia bacterium]|nr:hypothetical protein [Bacteroidia bacterium]
MKALIQSPWARLFWLSLILQLLTAWFSKGYIHVDEHFQILEFANYKLGHTPAADLPWEFAAHIRPSLQPTVAAGVMELLGLMGMHDPFISSFTLRLLIGIASWFVVCKLILLLLPSFTSKLSQTLFVCLCLFVWFVPYITVRFSSENAGSVCLLAGVYLLLKNQEMRDWTYGQLFFSGIFLALAFFLRFQLAFAIAGLGCWLLIGKKISIKQSLTLIVGSAIAVFLCVCIDRWFYGQWVFTPYAYFKVNILDHVAASFGTAPWWAYFTMFTETAAPPVSIALVILLVIGLYSKPLGLFSCMLIPFVLGHILLSHKELRFLLPVWFPFVVIVSQGMEKVANLKISKGITRSVFWVVASVNLFLLAYRVFIPAQESIGCYNYVYTHVSTGDLYCIGRPLYSIAGVKVDFYRPPGLKEIVLKDEQSLKAMLEPGSMDSLLVFTTGITLEVVPATYICKRIYCNLPEWVVEHLNFNNWESRADIWCLNAIRKIKP